MNCTRKNSSYSIAPIVSNANKLPSFFINFYQNVTKDNLLSKNIIFLNNWSTASRKLVLLCLTLKAEQVTALCVNVKSGTIRRKNFSTKMKHTT